PWATDSIRDFATFFRNCPRVAAAEHRDFALVEIRAGLGHDSSRVQKCLLAIPGRLITRRRWTDHCLEYTDEAASTALLGERFGESPASLSGFRTFPEQQELERHRAQSPHLGKVHRFVELGIGDRLARFLYKSIDCQNASAFGMDRTEPLHRRKPEMA